MSDRLNEVIEELAAVTLQLSETQALADFLWRRKNELTKEKERLTIPTFDSVYDIKWTQEDEFNQENVFRGVKDFKKVRVGDKMYKRFNAFHMPDWYAIAHHRVFDVVNLSDGAHAAEVQENDDSWESDWEDMLKFVREYEGGLRVPLDTWKRNPTAAKLREEYLKTHEDPGVEYKKRNPATLAAYGGQEG